VILQKRKCVCPCQKQNPGRPTHNLVPGRPRWILWRQVLMSGGRNWLRSASGGLTGTEPIGFAVTVLAKTKLICLIK
jgi:hypothetical protein